MALPGLGPFATASSLSSSEDPSKKIRKPYTITKSRESWTDPEHDKFLEALQLFDRDWKKIEAFIGSKTAIQRISGHPAAYETHLDRAKYLQIRSHAQKYFLKVQKSGTNEHLPPPRPKRKAAHPYPQKASKNAQIQALSSGSLQPSAALPDSGYILGSDTLSMHQNLITSPAASSKTNNVQTISFSHQKGPAVVNNSSSSSDKTSKPLQVGETSHQGNRHPLRVLPDFSQVYGFIGSVFDPNASDHLHKLKKMDPIDIETVLLLMRNLSLNLASPDFEDHRRLLSSSEIELDTTKSEEIL